MPWLRTKKVKKFQMRRELLFVVFLASIIADVNQQSSSLTTFDYYRHCILLKSTHLLLNKMLTKVQTYCIQCKGVLSKVSHHYFANRRKLSYFKSTVK